MPYLRSVALGTLLIASVVTLAAQEVRDTIGPIEKTARPSSPENPIPRRIASASPMQPAELTRLNGSGRVQLVATVDTSGRVAEIRKIGEPVVLNVPNLPGDATRRAAAESMVRAATAALAQWKYEAPAAPIVFVALFNFATGTEPAAFQQNMSTVQAARGVPPPSPPWPAAERAGAIRGFVPGMTQPKQTKNLRPRYTRDAMDAKVQGTVAMEILIGTDGKVKDARVVRTVSPLLNQPALDAVRQWEFTPALLNGEPRAVVLLAEMDFNLR